ncbi:hypothetical protein ACH5AO_04245 [Streptomyces sp. NPDC018964]|uniref:hypothetical protein n=1 Tax=unclassified Streptomyces TaxID=2593676 RepID=UPI003789C56A
MDCRPSTVAAWHAEPLIDLGRCDLPTARELAAEECRLLLRLLAGLRGCPAREAASRELDRRSSRRGALR